MAKKVKCEFCGREIDVRGIRLHRVMCKENPNRSNTIPQKEPQQEQPKNNDVPQQKSECVHVLKLLNSNDPQHKKCKDMGYISYCVLCGELFKGGK